MAERQEEKEQDKARPRSRWSVAMLSLPSITGRSRSHDRADQGRVTKSVAKISFWKRKTANITDYDPTYRVIYLGNVLTGWAKGDGCVDKPLSTLWRNHISSEKADILMKVTVVGSGLRAVTKEHGLTEYWANRVTYCAAHPSYPRVFCWIYRHEGRKMKQELRCHAVLCPKEDKAKQMAACLQDRLHQALVDFKKEKISRQNARLSLANCLQDNPSMPYRKLLLQTGTCNYKPPIERSKSAPKLTSIVEAEQEEEEWDEYVGGGLERVQEEEEVREDEDEEEVLVHCEPPLLPLSSPPNLRCPRLPSSSPPIYTKPDSIIIFEEQDSDEEDEIKDYIGEGEVDSAASESPASQGREEGRSRMERSGRTSSLSDQEEEISAGLGKVKVTEQDTISDESGYSEEPGCLGKEVTVVKVNLTGETPAGEVEFLGREKEKEGKKKEEEEDKGQHKLEIRLQGGEEEQQITITGRNGVRWSQPINVEPGGFYSEDTSTDISPRSLSASPPSESSSSPRTLSPLLLLPSLSERPPSPASPPPLLPPSPREMVSSSPRLTDLSVKSVLLSEFSSTEKIRYIERSGLKAAKTNSMVLNRQEFCINI